VNNHCSGFFYSSISVDSCSSQFFDWVS